MHFIALKNSKHFEKWLFYREQHPNKNDNDNIHIRQSHYSAYTFIVFLPIVISVAFIIAGFYYYYFSCFFHLFYFYYRKVFQHLNYYYFGSNTIKSVWVQVDHHQNINILFDFLTIDFLLDKKCLDKHKKSFRKPKIIMIFFLNKNVSKLILKCHVICVKISVFAQRLLLNI